MLRKNLICLVEFCITIYAIIFLLPAFYHAQANRPTAYKFGEYVYTEIEDEKVHLKPFAEELKRNPKAQAYIIGYGDPFYRYGDTNAKQRAGYARLSLVYLVNSSIDWDNVITVDGGFREQETVELFVVPPGANPPKPTPTVPVSNVTFCPLISVSAPVFVWNLNQPIKFNAYVRYDDKNTQPIYQWTVSYGEIIAGQGTSEIEVKLPEGGYRSITANFEVSGFPQKCSLQDSVASPANFTMMPYKVDEYGAINCESEMARLDNYAIYTQQDFEIQAHIIVYGARSGNRRGEVAKRIARIKDYLIRNRGLDPKKVVIIAGGYQNEMKIELWLKPENVVAPTPKPSVAPKDVKFRKGRIQKWELNCDHLGL